MPQIEEFPSAETFTNKYCGREAALHYLRTVFLPEAKKAALRGHSISLVYAYDKKNPEEETFARLLNSILVNANWDPCFCASENGDGREGLWVSHSDSMDADDVFEKTFAFYGWGGR